MYIHASLSVRKKTMKMISHFHNKQEKDSNYLSLNKNNNRMSVYMYTCIHVHVCTY